MTTKELKEIALQIKDISGVHGMNKDELIAVIKEDRGIVDEKKTEARDMREVKKKILALKGDRASAIEAGDKLKMKILRRKISRLKKKTRKAA